MLPKRADWSIAMFGAGHPMQTQEFNFFKIYFIKQLPNGFRVWMA